MNQNGNRGRVPRRTTIADQDHMLAYITPAEALMLRRNGGSGQPGPGGIPAYFHAAGHGEGGQKEWNERQAAANRKPLTNRYGVSLAYNQDSSSAEKAYRAATAAAKASGVDLSGGARAAGRGVGTGTFRGGVEQLYEKDGNTSSSTGYDFAKGRVTTDQVLMKEKYRDQAAEAAKQNAFGKPNIFGYGYFAKDDQGNFAKDNQGNKVWVPPSIDMRDGGGKGIAGFYFGSSGGVDADKNKDGYVDENEFNTGVEEGVMKQGFGRVSNAIGATPLFSGREPEGIAKFFQTGGLMGGLMGVDPPKVRANLKGQYTQADIDQYVSKQAELAQDASYRAATMRTSLDDEPGLNYVDPNAVTGVTGDVIKQVAPIGGDTVVPQTNYITGTGIVPSNAFGMQNFNQQPYPQLGMATNLVTPNAFRPALTYAELLAGYTNPYGNKPAGVV